MRCPRPTPIWGSIERGVPSIQSSSMIDLDEEADDMFIVTKPRKDPLSMREDFTHLLHLMVTLVHVPLVDAQCIYP